LCWRTSSLPVQQLNLSVSCLPQTLEVVCIIAFSGEYLLRLLCCTARPVEEGTRAGLCNWFWQPMCMVDLVAIAPFWIELFFGGEISLGVLRMLRMTRIFRVLKVGSFAQDLQLFTDGMSRASEGLMLLFFLLLLYFCVFATLLHMFEYEAQIDCRLCPTCGCPAWRGFTSIPNTMYFIMATMTTVGYGDMYPITTMGQIICSFCMFCSIVALGLPIVVVGVAFEATFAVRATASQPLTATHSKHSQTDICLAACDCGSRGVAQASCC
jgi:voltage-gated potassium channel